MISNFFIDRPLFAMVVSAFIVIAGLASFQSLPVSMYPDIAPPTVGVSAVYPGASAEVVAETVAAPLEQALNGVEGMLYMRSANASNGAMQLTITFAVGTNPDIAVINVQNRVQSALPLLPEEVRRQGVTVAKSLPSFLQVVTLDCPDGRYDQLFLSNYATVNVLDELRRIPGVGDLQVFGARDYSIRIWLKPDRLAEFGLTPADVAAAVREQNTQSAAGRLGDEPMNQKVDLTLNVTTQGRLAEPEQFERIVLKTTGPAGQIVRLKDVARVELGARDYTFGLTRQGRPTVGAAVVLAPDANALQVAGLVRAKMEELSKRFPAGIIYAIPYDTSIYVKQSMHEVTITFIEAMVLVFGVVWLFLYNLRATLIPTMAVPVSLIGTFAGMHVLGFSINSLTLFGMVLSIGIVVDDAIVVLENVERHIRAEHVDPKEATRRAMSEVSRPVIAIVLVLNAVFLPVAFLGGLVGEMYRQFAITIAVSVTISGFVALTLTPAMCALLLRAGGEEPRGILARFDAGFLRFTKRYVDGVAFVMRHRAVAGVLIVAMLGAIWYFQHAVPSALAPDEDQGYVIAIAALPPAASLQRTDAALKQLDKAAFAHPAYQDNFTVSGLDVLTNAQRSNAGVSFIILKDWSERHHKGMSATDVAGALFGAGMAIRDAFVFSLSPPAIQGLSNTGGFEGFIQARVGNDYAQLEAVTQKFIAAAAKRPEVTGVGTSYSAGVPRVQVSVDLEKAKLLGISMDDVNLTLQSTFGALYVNDFNRNGRVYRVQMQSESDYRAHPEDLRDVYVKTSQGAMVPLTAIAEVKEVTGPDVIERYNLFPSARLFGEPAPGYSSGQALAAMEQLAAQVLPDGYQLDWSGQSFQEKTSSKNTAGVFGLAVLMVFLILAAQYERLTLPLAVILAVPFAVFGAFLAVWLRGLYDDLYLQIGLVTLVGLAAKNAILIVEFAAHIHKEQGKTLVEAALEAARLRFRPIVMTSLAFILGVLPLAVSTGAGAASRHSIGTGVIGGMLAATFIAVLFIPLFFVLTSRMGEVARDWWRTKVPHRQHPPAAPPAEG
ncbi:MAG TPA: multidrug efflux RND transporter permease subunit [Steroidobacteraceae bacterium]|nr:multidrug efflux RND transporter permease subunit [Steroidobacteraceae bacterium]